MPTTTTAAEMTIDNAIDALYQLNSLDTTFQMEDVEVLIRAYCDRHGIEIAESVEIRYDEKEEFFDRINAMDAESITKFTAICKRHLNFSNIK